LIPEAWVKNETGEELPKNGAEREKDFRVQP
jgi:hypothetical protein